MDGADATNYGAAMLGDIRISVRPAPRGALVSFEQLLQNPIFSDEAIARLQSCLCHEQLPRANYHKRRYLKHLTEDELHLRVGYLIANVVYVSNRNRYSTNNRYCNYWRDRLAHTAEELSIRNCKKAIDPDILRHLPKLGFLTPREPALRHDPGARALYRYDKLRYIKKLHRAGEVYLRCASSEDRSNDFARNDDNELCVKLRLLAKDIELSSTSRELASRQWMEVLDFSIYQKTDFFMFCLSQVYDWRLFGDFTADAPSDDPEDRIACLVIAEPRKFASRFASAVDRFKSQHGSKFDRELQLSARSACYYDACDAQECAPLFENRHILPFAKRREFTYQHEFRFVIKPNLPEDFVPAYEPKEIPRFRRDFLNLGGLEDISYIVKSDGPPRDQRTYYLSSKNTGLLASAIGVTLPNSEDKVRFTYSVECKEKGRTDANNLIAPTRFSGGSLQVAQQQIDVPTDSSHPQLLQLVRDFYSVFDVREQGNHLIGFEFRYPPRFCACKYRAYLPCPEPPDDELEAFPLTFEFEYAFLDQEKRVVKGNELIEIDGDTYLARFNGVGPAHRQPTYRSLLIAEMEFIRRAIEKGIDGILSYEAKSRELGYRCSEFKATGDASEGNRSRSFPNEYTKMP
jgi:hypothetical protein